MKYSNPQLTQFQKSQDPNIRVALIYGPDEGLVRERAKTLLTAIVDDPGDPFRVTELDLPAVLDDPARLPDEAAAISMMGGRRVVRITNAGDRLTKILADFLETLPGDGFIIISAGDLTAKGSLRKLVEGSDVAFAVACFSDNAETRDALIDSILVKAGHELDRDARAYLNDHLGNDRMVSRQELEKLALFKGSDNTPISLEDASLNVGDSASRAFDEAGSAALGGQFPALLAALGTAYQGGDNPVGILRLVSRRLQRLHLVASMAESGSSQESGFKALRPPAFSREAAEMRRLLNRWNAPRLAEALKILSEAEQLCKTTGMPAEAICTRALMRLAGAARQAA